MSFFFSFLHQHSFAFSTNRRQISAGIDLYVIVRLERREGDGHPSPRCLYTPCGEFPTLYEGSISLRFSKGFFLSLLASLDFSLRSGSPCLFLFISFCLSLSLLLVFLSSGYTCKQIMEFVGGDCSVYLKDLSSSPLPPQVPPSTTLEDACPFTCGACAAEECVDNPLVESLGYTCKMILDASEGRGGCEATLQSLTPNPLPKDIPPYTRVKDACMKSCDACPTLRDTDPEDECHDDIRLPQLGFSCDILLAYATRGCSTPLYELFPPGTTLFDRSTLAPSPNTPTTISAGSSHAGAATSSEILPVAPQPSPPGVLGTAGGGPLDPNEPLSTYCRLSCNQCTQKKKRRSGGSSSHKGSHHHHAASSSSSGCRNNPLVEAHGFSCSLLVKASSLGCNARLQDLSDSPLPPGVPPQTRVRDACLLECGGCIEIPTCYDGFQNGDEEGIDCGGSCRPCHACSPTLFKQLGEAYEIVGGKGIQHGAIRELRCAKTKGYEKVGGGGKESETLVCQDGVFPKPTLKCDVKKVEVQYASMTIENAGVRSSFKTKKHLKRRKQWRQSDNQRHLKERHSQR